MNTQDELVRTGPADYTDGLGEVIRAYRLYMGLSRSCMAIELGVSIRTYERIEDGARDCPPGLIDSIRTLVQNFELAVAGVLEAGITHPVVRLGVDGDWDRAVYGRAAISDPRITPELVD